MITNVEMKVMTTLGELCENETAKAVVEAIQDMLFDLDTDEYDEDYEAYMCDMDMDEDEYAHLMSDERYSCPYYRNGDEYAVVRKQM